MNGNFLSKLIILRFLGWKLNKVFKTNLLIILEKPININDQISR